MRAVRRAARPAAEPRYLRPEGNRRLRRRRRTRAALRVAFWMAVLLGGAGAATAALLGTWRIVTDPGRFPLGMVIVEGGPESVRKEVAASLGPLHGRNLFNLDLDQAELVVRSHPWVSAASVHRRLPDTLLVVLSPRRVEALYQTGAEIRMAGSGGQDLGPYEPRWAGEDRPVITGLGAARRGELAGRLQYALNALDELRSASPGFVETLSTLDVGRSDRLVVTLRDFAPPIYLSPSMPARNLDRLPSVRARLAAEQVDVEYLDLRFRNRIVTLPILEDGGEDAT